jgi:hypothetical protein
MFVLEREKIMFANELHRKSIQSMNLCIEQYYMSELKFLKIKINIIKK